MKTGPLRLPPQLKQLLALIVVGLINMAAALLQQKATFYSGPQLRTHLLPHPNRAWSWALILLSILICLKGWPCKSLFRFFSR